MYKIFTANICMPSGYARKFLLIMKITTFILFLAFMQASASVFSQKITYKENEVSLKKVLNEINKQTGYNVFWSSKSIKKTHKLDANFQNSSIEEVLNSCLKDLSLTYTIEGKSIIIKDVSVGNTKAPLDAIIADITVRITKGYLCHG
jgi:type II secretory pathway component GspD/PulD (secretin)